MASEIPLDAPGRDPLVVVERTETYNVFALIGFVELTLGLASVLAADFLHVFSPLALFAGCMGPIVLVLCVIRPLSVKVYDLFSGALMFGYGSSTLYALVSYLRDNQQLIGGDDISQYWYARTLGLVVAACGALHVLGSLDRSSFLFRRTTFTRKQHGRALAMGLLTLAVYLAYVKTGKIGFSANIVSETDGATVSPVAVTLLALVTPIGALALSMALTASQARSRLWLLALAAMLLLSQVSAGRRIFAFSAITYVLAALTARRPEKLLSFRNIVLTGIAVLVLQAGMTFFYAMRLAMWSHGGATQGHVSTLELIPEALEIYTGNRTVDLQAALAKNVQTRSFILSYLKDLVEGEARSEPMYGEDALRAVVTAIPSVIFPGKQYSRWFGSEEPLINPAFGLPVWDAPNSIFTAGVADFGSVGIFLYPLLLCFILARVLNLTYRWAPGPAAALISFYLCEQLLSIEADITYYVLAPRMVVVILVLAWIFFRGQSTPPAVAP
jgi:hypothetical protein